MTPHACPYEWQHDMTCFTTSCCCLVHTGGACFGGSMSCKCVGTGIELTGENIRVRACKHKYAASHTNSQPAQLPTTGHVRQDIHPSIHPSCPCQVGATHQAPQWPQQVMALLQVQFQFSSKMIMLGLPKTRNTGGLQTYSTPVLHEDKNNGDGE